MEVPTRVVGGGGNNQDGLDGGSGGSEVLSSGIKRDGGKALR